MFHVPILDDRGTVDKLLRGPIWKNVVFRVLISSFTDERLEKELKKFLLYNLYGSENSDNAYFSIAYKIIDIPMYWEKDYLSKQIAIPWKEGGIYTPSSDIYSWTLEIKSVFKKEKVDRYQ